jgi:RNA polymerase sigma factor (sigma-70 family)
VTEGMGESDSSRSGDANAGGPTEGILRRHRAGDQRARDDFYAHYTAKLLPMVRAMMGEGLQAKVQPEDLVQEVLRRSLRTLDLLERGESPQIFGLFRLLLREVAVDEARRIGARKRSDRAETSLDVASPPAAPTAATPTPSSLVSRGELREQLRRAEARLSESHRRVLELRWKRHLTLTQVARELDITPEAAGKLEARAREALRRALEEDGLGPGTALGTR